jgi:hypothetical protein
MSFLKVSAHLLFVLIFIMLSGCGSPTGTPVPTLYPTQYVPTVIAMTVTAQEIESPESNPKEFTDASASPTVLPSPTPSEVRPSETPSPTPYSPQTFEDLPPPDGIPQSSTQIHSPGPGSKVISPFNLRAALKLNQNSVIHLELLGEDGRLLMREVSSYQSIQTEWINLESEVSFGINGNEESGRMMISVEDEHGRLGSVSSIDLILLSGGDQELNTPADLLENIVLESPPANHLIQNGKMRVSGLARTRSDQPLRIELVSSDGRIVGTRQVSVTHSEDNSYGTFAIDVPYTVSSTQSVRVQIWEPGDRIPGVVNLSSVEVLLAP